ncbi:unnamed protein product [Malassezia sympodialis ATCC 42132]|uniref:uncharacterized protein n=1 Tax=Malassezia sympodialis (strain ATCC 42132) TaxID=1230383 RepID=UPI0002C1D9E3|nr:uncharacterized protein MSY001_0133 [Malassezia sympodialis ATCC 42132]CCU97427.1 unnamed protein product [Malassezia sympodialis ATCC 42132]|eukprot:XP_018738778.1 uncharacterized protein MSY001_0133 [Malassezia sympodialis ATCC 42132]
MSCYSLTFKFGMFSMLFKERLYLGEAPLALVFGIIVGPSAASIFHPNTWGDQPTDAPGTEITREITLEVMRLPKKYVWRHWRSISMLLGPVMLWGWLITGLLIWALIPGIDYLSAYVLISNH